MKKLFWLLLVVAPLVLSACYMPLPLQDIHGGGRLTLVDVHWLQLTLDGQSVPPSMHLTPGEAQTGDVMTAINFMCNDNKDAIRGTLIWNDAANGIQATLHQAWLPLAGLYGESASCATLAQDAAEMGMSFISAENQWLWVGAPGVDVATLSSSQVEALLATLMDIVPLPSGTANLINEFPATLPGGVCSPDQSSVLLLTEFADAVPQDPSDPTVLTFGYAAFGCLSHGNLVFQ